MTDPTYRTRLDALDEALDRLNVLLHESAAGYSTRASGPSTKPFSSVPAAVTFPARKYQSTSPSGGNTTSNHRSPWVTHRRRSASDTNVTSGGSSPGSSSRARWASHTASTPQVARPCLSARTETISCHVF